jgi:hypothetical protein
MSRKLYLQAVGQIVQALSDMGFRVIALAPSSSVSDEVLNDLRQLRVGHDQAEVRVVDPPKPESSVGPIEEACRRLIPRDTRTRRLDGEWRVNSEWRIASLSEGVYGSGDVRIYEHSFYLSESEARGAILLDLGVVENHCEVVINDTAPIVDHWLPYTYRVGNRLKAGSNKLKVTVRHKPQPTLDAFYYRVAPPRLVGPVTLTFWNP